MIRIKACVYEYTELLSREFPPRANGTYKHTHSNQKSQVKTMASSSLRFSVVLALVVCIAAVTVPVKQVSADFVCVGSEADCAPFESGDETAAPWRIPPFTAPFEPIYASVGDTLFFGWTGFHNVELMPSEESYDACDFSASLVNDEIPGASALAMNAQGVNTLFVELTEPGTYYFACGIGGHCFARQKIIVFVSGAPAPDNELSD